MHFLDGAAKSYRDGIFGCKIYFAKGYETHKERYQDNELGKVIWYAGGLIDWSNCYSSHRGVDEVDKGQFDRNFETDFVTGACMLIKRQVIEEVGLFDPKYFLYLEENDLCQRAKRKNYKLIFLYQPTAWHENAQATGLGSTLHDYYLTRNRLLFGLKYAPLYTKFALLRESYRMLKSGRPWQKRGVMDFYTGNFGAGSYQSE
jgi:GT2 family glycosyltransferase